MSAADPQPPPEPRHLTEEEIEAMTLDELIDHLQGLQAWNGWLAKQLRGE